MNEARFVHNQVQLAGWDDEVAHALEGQRPGAAGRPDRRINVCMLAELCGRELVPAIWLPAYAGAPSASRPAFASTLVPHCTPKGESIRRWAASVSPARCRPCLGEADARLSGGSPSGPGRPTWP
jgi:hypothetical protein